MQNVFMNLFTFFSAQIQNLPNPDEWCAYGHLSPVYPPITLIRN